MQKESQQMVLTKEEVYEEPVYQDKEEEDRANRKAYEEMQTALKSLKDASDEYARNFHPVYEELSKGLMNAFLSGREKAFYRDLSSYCFGRYNTTSRVGRVRFCTLTEKDDQKERMILEIFTEGSSSDEDQIPDLTYCTYNRSSQAFIFSQGRN